MRGRSALDTLFEYKAWANHEILAATRLFDQASQAAARNVAIRKLNHTYVVDQIFAAHLKGTRHGYAATNTTDTPTLDALTAAISASDQWYVAYVSKLEPAQLGEFIDFACTDGARGRMSREEMLMHILLHGEYHRGQVGRIMEEHAIAPPRPFTSFLQSPEFSTRRRAVI